MPSVPRNRPMSKVRLGEMARGPPKRRGDTIRKNDACWTMVAVVVGLLSLHYLWWISLWEDGDYESKYHIENREVLRIPITFNNEQHLLELRKGESIDETVEDFVWYHDIPADQAGYVRDSLRLQAWSHGFIPSTKVKILDQTTGARLSVELHQGDDVEERIREAGEQHGIPDYRLESFVEGSILSLIVERVVPLFTVDVEVEGVKGQVRYFYEDRLEDTVQHFCKLHRLSGKAMRAVGNAVHAEAMRRKVIPSLSLLLNVQDQRTGELVPVELEIYYGDDLEDRLKKFEEKHRLSGEAAIALKAALVRQAMLKKIIPILELTLAEVTNLGCQPRSQEEGQGGPFGPSHLSSLYGTNAPDALRLFSGDDFALQISNFLDVNNLSYAGRSTLINMAKRSAVLNGVEPLAWLRLDLKHYDNNARAKRALLPLHHGMPLVESVGILARRYGLSDEAQKKLLLDSRKLMGRDRGKIVAALDMLYNDGTGGVPLTVEVREGYEITELAREYAAQINVKEKDASRFESGLAVETKKLKALPTLAFRVEVPEKGWAPLHVYSGENMSEVVENFVNDLGIPDKHDEVFCEVVKSAIDKQLIPAATSIVSILDRKWKGPSEMFLDFHNGVDVENAVKSMSMYYDLSEEQMAAIAREARKRLVQEDMMFPVEIVLVNLGGVNVSIPIYENEKHEDALERAKEYKVWGDKLSESEKSLMHQMVMDMFVDLGIAPLLLFGISVQNRGKFDLKIFKGETLGQAVARFAQEHKLSKPQSMKALKIVRKELVTRKLVPAFSVNVTVPGGSQPLNFFLGDSVNTAVKEFGQKYGFSEKRIAKLTKEALVRAARARIMPILTLNYTVDCNTYQLQMFHGDSIQESVAKAAQKHNIMQEDIEKFEQLALSHARELKLLPSELDSSLLIDDMSIEVLDGGRVDVDLVSSNGLPIDSELLARVSSQLGAS